MATVHPTSSVNLSFFETEQYVLNVYVLLCMPINQITLNEVLMRICLL